MVSFFFFLLSSLQHNHSSQLWQIFSFKTFFTVQIHPAEGQENFWKHPEGVCSKTILKQKDENYCGSKGKKHLRNTFPVCQWLWHCTFLWACKVENINFCYYCLQDIWFLNNYLLSPFWPRITLAICGFLMANDNVTVKTIIFKNVYYITVDKNRTKPNKYKKKKTLKMLLNSLLEKTHICKCTYRFKSVK